MKRFFVAIMGIILFMPSFIVSSGGTGGPTPTKPKVEWMSDEGMYYPYFSTFCDTDGDSQEEIFTYNDLEIWAFDPPNNKCVLGMIGVDYLNGPIFEDLGRNGSIQIIGCDEFDPSTVPHNYSIYSGKDFSLIWRSPDWRSPSLGNSSRDIHMLKDTDKDGEPEFIWVANDSLSGDCAARIYVYGGISHNMEWNSPLYSCPISLSFKNLDSDPALEMIVETHPTSGEIASSLQVYDSATHQLQWDIPAANVFVLRPHPANEMTEDDNPLEVQDLNNDGIAEIPIEYTRPIGTETTDSGIRIYSGNNGAVLWNATVSGNVEDIPNDIWNISDVDSDGQKELVVTSEIITKTGTNETDIRIYSGSNGSLEWNISFPDYPAALDIDDIDGDPGLELLVSSINGNASGSHSNYFEIIDLKEHNINWNMGPIDGAGSANFYAEDIDRNGISEIIFANCTVSIVNYTEYRHNYSRLLYHGTFQVMDGSNFNIRWTSPICAAEDPIYRMELMSFDDISPPVIIICNYTMVTSTEHANTIFELYSPSDFHGLWNMQYPKETVYYYSENHIGDSRNELIIYVRFEDPNSFHYTVQIIDTASYQMIWSTPASKTNPHYFIPSLTSGDLNGNMKKELILTDSQDVISSISIYNDTTFQEQWSTHPNDAAFQYPWDNPWNNMRYKILGVSDLDKDSRAEVLIFLPRNDIPKLIYLEFSRDGNWAQGIDMASPSLRINKPEQGTAVSGLVNISGNASDKLFLKKNIEIYIECIYPPKEFYYDEWGCVTLMLSKDNRSVRWYYLWNTSGLDPGKYEIWVFGSNGIFNENSTGLSVTIYGSRSNPTDSIQPVSWALPIGIFGPLMLSILFLTISPASRKKRNKSR